MTVVVQIEHDEMERVLVEHVLKLFKDGTAEAINFLVLPGQAGAKVEVVV